MKTLLVLALAALAFQAFQNHRTNKLVRFVASDVQTARKVAFEGRSTANIAKDLATTVALTVNGQNKTEPVMIGKIGPEWEFEPIAEFVGSDAVARHNARTFKELHDERYGPMVVIKQGDQYLSDQGPSTLHSVAMEYLKEKAP